MCTACLALLLSLAPGAGPDPTTLVSRLGAARYAEREAAAEALEALGRDALDALRAARADRDAEVQVRAEALLERIEGSLLTRPTLVRLDGQGRPLAEVVRDLGEQSGVALVVHGLDLADPQPRVALRLAEPTPFWRALDRLGVVGLWARDPLPNRPRESRPVLHLVPRRDRPPACDTGPFRAELRRFAGGHGSYNVTLVVTAEPRLRIAPDDSPPRLVAAVDDRGRTYAPRGEWQCEPQAPRAADLGEATLPQLVVSGRLSGPDRPGRTFKRLRVAVPIAVTARKLEPVTVALAPPERAAGKVFTTDEQTVVVQSVRDDPERQTSSVELYVIPHRPAEPDPFPMRRRGFNQRLYLEVDRLLRRLALVDAQGRTLPFWRTNGRLWGDPNGARIALVVEAGSPAELRYHDTIRTTTEVEFELTDVELP